MNDQTEKTASALAIPEKKPHRPGGCVGIFFQLFDWNRRFAKKKLFSRKLLPPVPARTKASKKFGGDEKMPKSKLHLIADANSGGFPNVKKNSKHSNGEMEQKHEMRAPGLVARLMGLESLPAVNRDKSNKKSLVSDSNNSGVRNGGNGANGEELDSKKSRAKVEPRPQKIQKVETNDRRAVTRFGAEAFQIKSVMSLSKKHHHHHHHQKFVSPVRSPRISSLRNASRASRFIDVATKILEPGLQATNRAKHTLAYSSSLNNSSKNEDVTRGIGVQLPEVLKSGFDVGTGTCNNCGNVLVDVVESRTELGKQPFVCPSFAPNFLDPSSQGLEKDLPRCSPSSFSQGKEVIIQRCHDQPLSFTGREDITVQSSNESNTLRKPLPREALAQWPLPSQLGKTQDNEKSPIAFKPRNQTQNHISLDRDRIPARAKSSNLQSRRAASAANAVSGAKDFIALDRSFSQARHRAAIKVDSSIELDRKYFRDPDDSLSQLRSPVRKKRTISVNGQDESAGFASSAVAKERNAKCNPVIRRDMMHSAPYVDRICVKSRSTSQETGNGAKDKTISFSFNSPIKQNHAISMELKDEEKNQSVINHRSASFKRNEMLEDTYGGTSLKNLPLTGDALSVLLEQKLKELTSQEEYDLKSGCSLPKRSTTMILRELISALTSEQPNSRNGRLFNSDMAFQTEAKPEGTSVGFASHGNHFSPGSVLEASFSNDDSCVSSILDESFGHRLHPDSMDYSYDEQQQTEVDADLLDSATSLDDKGTNAYKMITDLVNPISVALHVISNFGLELSGDKLIYVEEAILTAELLFGKVTPGDRDATKDLLLQPFVHDEVQTLAGAMQIDLDSLLLVNQSKEINLLRGFLFDCAIEFLDSKYIRYCNSGFRAWRSLPLCVDTGKLVQDVGEEIRRWTKLVGMVPDELIEWEMSYSLGKWTDFDIEEYETGAEMERDILRSLLEEIVVDLFSP